MFNYLMKVFTLMILLGGIQHTYGQKATEIFIPVGESPGLSGKYTIIGTVDSVKSQERSFVVSDSTGSYSMKITDTTQVWLDRSKLQLRNKKGSIEDIEPGLLVEVKYIGNKSDGLLEWVKVQLKEQKQN